MCLATGRGVFLGSGYAVVGCYVWVVCRLLLCWLEGPTGVCEDTCLVYCLAVASDVPYTEACMATDPVVCMYIGVCSRMGSDSWV